MTHRLFWTALLATALAACAPRGTRDPYEPRERPVTRPAEPEEAAPPRMRSYSEDELASFPRHPEEISGPAVLALLNQARADLDAGRTEQAVAKLERARRHEPRNPFIWQRLAGMQLQRMQMDQAETMAQRSNSLARGNPYIEIGNWRVIAAAREAQGDAEGVEQAQQRIDALQEQLED
jgi:predicted negative regulator of RcsB-dependent stress response